MLSIKKLLHTDGLAWLLLSPYECAAFEKAAMQQQLFFTSRYLIYDRADKPIRSIVCVSHKKISFKVEEITIYNPDRTYTEAFIQRLQPFYLYL
jgi:tRNA1(Val) A37 N6-methylase TrmN6